MGYERLRSKLKLSIAVGCVAHGAGFPLLDASAPPELRRFEYSQIHMGGAVKLTLYAESEQKAETAAKAAFARFAELEQIMSDYRPTSEIVQLAAKAVHKPVKVSEDLWRVIRRALDVARYSEGAFDPTCGPIVALWREARQTVRLPDPAKVAEAKSRTGWKFVKLDAREQTVQFEKPGMKLDLGGIAKGDACDQAILTLKQHGVSRALVEAGGDLKVCGSPPKTSGWLIAIKDWDSRLTLRDRAVSTSGDAEQFVEIEGKRYSHIVDPRTGVGVTNRIQATVVAPSGLTTDPLATAVCVLGPQRSRALLRRFGAKAMVVTQ